MKFGRIKTQWASIYPTSKGGVIVCPKSSDSSSCLYFESIEIFTDAVKKRKICVKNWTISVPEQQCITKSIDLPVTDIGQAYKMLEFEIPSHLPIPAEELVYGCLPVRQNDNLLTVLVYILKIKTLEDILTGFRAIGIKPAKVIVDSIAIRQWLNQNKNNDIAEIDVLIEKNRLFILAITNSILKRYDTIYLKDNDLEINKKHVIDEMHYIASEIVNGKEVQLVLKIATREDSQAALRSWFDGIFNNIKFVEPPELVSYDGNSCSPAEQFIFESVITRGLVEAAQDPDLAFLNLLPKKVIEKANRKQFVANIALTFILAVFLIFCLRLNFGIMNFRIQRACQRISKEISPIKHIAAEVENKRQKVKAIQKQLSCRNQISHIFSEIYKYSPKEIAISQISYLLKADTATINIKGQSDTLSNAFEYSNAMKESKLLSNMQISNAQQIPRPGGSIVEFKAECVAKEK